MRKINKSPNFTFVIFQLFDDTLMIIINALLIANNNNNMFNRTEQTLRHFKIKSVTEWRRVVWEMMARSDNRSFK